MRSKDNLRHNIILLSISAILLFFLFFSIYNINNANQNIKSIYQDRVIPLKQLKIVSDYYSINIYSVVKSLKEGEIASIVALKHINKSNDTINRYWNQYLHTFFSKEEVEKVKQTKITKSTLDSLIISYCKEFDKIEPFSKEKGLSLINSKMDQLNHNIDDLVSIQIQEANHLGIYTQSLFKRTIEILILIVILSLSVFFLIKQRFKSEEALKLKSEEFQNINEELQATNEELDSTNAELIASNEDLESVNKQLLNANEELENIQKHLEEIVDERTRDYIKENLFNKLIIDFSPNYLIALSPDGRIRMMNRALLKILEVRKEEVNGLYYVETFVSEKDKAVVNENLQKLRDGQTSVIYQNTITNRSGKNIIVEWHCVLVKQENEPDFFFCVGMDITQRIIDEHTIRHSEEKFSKAFYSSPIPKSIINPGNGIFIDCNEALCELFGYSRNEFIGKSTIELGLWENLEDRRLFIEEINKNGRVHNKELRIRKKSGEIVISKTSSDAICFGNERYLLSVFEDITESKFAQQKIKESEERFRVTFENAGIPMALVNKEGKPFKCNIKLQEMLGYSEQELSIMPFTQFTHPEDINKDWELYTELLKGKIEMYQIEKRFFKKTGELVWGNLTVSIVKTEYSNEEYAIAMVEDITRRKELERQVIKSVIETEEKERLNFSQELHDGLGPIISAIKMYIQLLTIPGSNMDVKDINEKAGNLIEEAMRVVREISFKLSPHILKNYGPIEALKSFIEKIKETKKIEIKIKHENIGRFDEVVETIVYRVLCECINNTLKHSNATQIDIFIKNAHDYLVVDFRDNGQGFDIQQVNKDRKGIGLSNIINRIESVNGTIHFESILNEGTSINFKVKTTAA